MNALNRRHFILYVVAASALRAESSASIRGKLKTGNPATIGTIQLSGDDATLGVLNDPRLDGADFEVLGHAIDPKHFEVDKIHTRSLFAYQAGKRLMITYWCDVCYIRTYTPGKCWCCQKDTDLDLRETLD